MFTTSRCYLERGGYFIFRATLFATCTWLALKKTEASCICSDVCKRAEFVLLFSALHTGKTKCSQQIPGQVTGAMIGHSFPLLHKSLAVVTYLEWAVSIVHGGKSLGEAPVATGVLEEVWRKLRGFFTLIGGYWQLRRSNGDESRLTEARRHAAAQPVSNGRHAQTELKGTSGPLLSFSFFHGIVDPRVVSSKFTSAVAATND